MKLKKLAILSLGVFVGVSLAACGNEIDPTPSGDNPVVTTTPATPSGNTTTASSSEEVKLNLAKTFVLEENNRFYGALNVIVKDNVLDSVTMLMENYPVTIKPVYENNVITSLSFITIDDEMYYNIKLTDTLSVSRIKVSKTTNGIKIGNLANTIWCEIKNDFTFETSNTISDSATKTFEDGTVVNSTNNGITVEFDNSDEKYEYSFNGINLECKFYKDGELTNRAIRIQDTDNPLKVCSTTESDNDDGRGFVVRRKVENELFEDYTIKDQKTWEYNTDLYGLKIGQCKSYEKTDNGYNMEGYYVYNGKKVSNGTAVCECIEGTNFATKSTYMMNGVKAYETTITYNDDFNPLTMINDGSGRYSSSTYTYDDAGHRIKEVEIEEEYTLDDNNNKVITSGDKYETERDSFDNEILSVSSEYDTLSKSYVKKSEDIWTYDTTGEYELYYEFKEYDDNKISYGIKHEYEYDDNYNLTKDIRSSYNTQYERYYKIEETLTTYENNKKTTIYTKYGERETYQKDEHHYNTKAETTKTDTGEVTIVYYYDFDLGAYVKDNKNVITYGQNGLDETQLNYSFNGDNEVLNQKETTIFGQNGLDHVHTVYDVDGTTETARVIDTYKYDANENLTYHKREELSIDKDDPTISTLVTKKLEEYEYNANGDYTKYLDADFYDDGDPMSYSRRTYEYDSSLRITKENYFDSLTVGDPSYSYIYDYLKDGDNDKLVTTVEHYDSNYKTVTTIVKNDNGIISKKNETFGKVNSEYVLTYLRVYSYDEYLELLKDEKTEYSNSKKTSYEGKETTYSDNTVTSTEIRYQYDGDEVVTSGTKEVSNSSYMGIPLSVNEYTYDTTKTDFVIASKIIYTIGSNYMPTAESYKIRYDWTTNKQYVSHWNPATMAWDQEVEEAINS